MPRLMTLREFLSSGNSIAIKKYRKLGILPQYVVKSKLLKKSPRKLPKKLTTIGQLRNQALYKKKQVEKEKSKYALRKTKAKTKKIKY